MSTEDRERFTMDISHEDGATVAHLRGRLDTYTSEAFSQRFPELLENDADVILDMTDLEYVSSAGLRALYNLNAQVKPNGRLAFCNLHHNVDRMFEIVDVKSMFDIYDDLEAAQQAAQS
jgi:anti-sigma B factor antagonist